jgi:tetratricopeptide (TPR) repeat protein
LFFFLVLVSSNTSCQHNPLEKTVDEIPPDSQLYTAPAIYYFTVAQLKLKEGNVNDSIFLLEKAIGFDPQSSYLKLELANLYIIKKSFHLALPVVQEVLENDPENVQALTLAGRIYQQQNQMAKAQHMYEQVLAVDGADANIYHFLGRLYWEADDLANATRVFRKMVETFPDAYSAHYFYGKVLMVQGDDSEAEAAFLKSLDLEPSLEEPRMELLKIYQKQNRPDMIAQIYDEIITNNPANYSAALGLAWHHQEMGKPLAAASILSDLGKRAQADNDVIKTLFKHYIEPKDYQRAVWALSGMLRDSPDNSDLNYLAGVAHDGLTQIDEVLEHLQKVEPHSRFYHNAVVQRALLFHDEGKIDQAIATVEEALKYTPDNVDYYLYLGSFFEELERYNEALKSLQEGLRIDDQNSRLHFRMGVVYDKMGRKTESIEAMKVVVRLKPDNAEALNYLGYTYTDLGINLDEAEALIQTALKIKPDDGYITDSLGWLNYKRGRYDEALLYLNRAVELVPDDPIILEHLGDVYLKLERPDKALLYYRRSHEKQNKNKESIKEKIDRLEKQ